MLSEDSEKKSLTKSPKKKFGKRSLFFRNYDPKSELLSSNHNKSLQISKLLKNRKKTSLPHPNNNDINKDTLNSYDSSQNQHISNFVFQKKIEDKESNESFENSFEKDILSLSNDLNNQNFNSNSCFKDNLLSENLSSKLFSNISDEEENSSDCLFISKKQLSEDPSFSYSSSNSLDNLSFYSKKNDKKKIIKKCDSGKKFKLEQDIEKKAQSAHRRVHILKFKGKFFKSINKTYGF